MKWFLEPTGDHRSCESARSCDERIRDAGSSKSILLDSYGAEISYFQEDQVVARTLKGRKWCAVNGTGDPQASADDPRARIPNKYSVLLTRFRKSMVIFVPLRDRRTTRLVRRVTSTVYARICFVAEFPFSLSGRPGQQVLYQLWRTRTRGHGANRRRRGRPDAAMKGALYRLEGFPANARGRQHGRAGFIQDAEIAQRKAPPSSATSSSAA